MNRREIPSTFHDMLDEYMKKNFERLLEVENDHNYLFNMLVAHLLKRLDQDLNKTKETFTDDQLEELNEYVDQLMQESKQSFEKALQALKEHL